MILITKCMNRIRNFLIYSKLKKMIAYCVTVAKKNHLK